MALDRFQIYKRRDDTMYGYLFIGTIVITVSSSCWHLILPQGRTMEGVIKTEVFNFHFLGSSYYFVLSTYHFTN